MVMAYVRRLIVDEVRVYLRKVFCSAFTTLAVLSCAIAVVVTSAATQELLYFLVTRVAATREVLSCSVTCVAVS